MTKQAELVELEKLDELRAEFVRRQRRVSLLTEGGNSGLNVWREPAERFAADTIYYRHSRSTGGGFTWGSSYQYGAPETVSVAKLADMIEETLN